MVDTVPVVICSPLVIDPYGFCSGLLWLWYESIGVDSELIVVGSD